MLEIISMKAAIGHIPFLIGVTGMQKMNYTRIVEALIIAALTAGGTGYITLKLLEQKSDVIEQRVDKIETKIDQLVKDLYEPRRR